MKNIDPKKKPVKYFVPVYPGILEYLERGLISWSQFGLYVGIHLQADYGTGLWLGSAPRLLNTAQRGAKLREIQRDLDRLVQVGLLKHFHRQGTRGNFPWIINKFICRSGALTGMRLNAEKSTSLESLCYEPCADDALTMEKSCADDGGLPSHLQEVKKLEVQESKKRGKSGAAKPAAPDPSARLYLEKIKKLSDSLTDSLVEKHQESWPEPPIVSFQFQKEYQRWADLHGIEYRDFQNLWRGAMRVAEWVVTPLEPKSPYGPFTAELIEQWAGEAAANPEVLEIIRNDDGTALTLVFATGFEEFRVGADEPDWFAYDPVHTRAMPDAPADAPGCLPNAIVSPQTKENIRAGG